MSLSNRQSRPFSRRLRTRAETTLFVLGSLRALAAVVALQISAPCAIAADQPAGGLIADSGDWTRGNSLYLEVTLNGSATGQLVHFDDRNGQLYTSAPTLRQLGFVLPADTADPVRLAGLNGVTIDYDVEHQRVAIQAPLQLLDLKTALLNTPENAVPDLSLIHI